MNNYATQYMTVEHVESFQDININYYNTKKAAVVLRSLSHRLRQEIIKAIHGSGRLTVTQLYIKLRLEQSVASQHLAILRRADIVITERDGKFIFYAINPKGIEEVNQFAKNLVN